MSKRKKTYAIAVFLTGGAIAFALSFVHQEIAIGVAVLTVIATAVAYFWPKVSP